MVSAMANAPIVVAGAGPVGLLVALELAHHGVRCVLLDRSLEPTKFPKMDVTNGRSMELFRRLGFAERLRGLGVAAHHSFDVLWARADGQEPFARWDLPSVQAQRDAIFANNDGSSPLEPDQRVQQSAFEQMGRDLCRESPLIDFLEGVAFEECTQDEVGVDVVVDAAGVKSKLRADYLVGADGAGSRIRRQLEIELDAAPDLGQIYMAHFRSRDLDVLHRYGRFWHYYVNGSVIIAQDERETWTFHTPLVGAPSEQGEVNPAAMIAERIGLSPRIDEVLLTSIWQPRFALAERYSRGRVFLAGDAVHQVFPLGGYGMNTGVGDAIDIGWKLAAVVKGWAGRRLLESYDAERRPVGATNRIYAERHLGAMRGIVEAAMSGAPNDELKRLVEASRGENEFDGVEFGYRYTNSPVLGHEAGEPPPWSEWRYVASTWPGARAPSFILEDGTALFDQLGKGMTLVDFVGDAGALVEAAAAQGVPIKHLSIREQKVRKVWERDYVLVRPDHHVSWRSNKLPDALQWQAIIAHVCGRAA